MSVFKVYHERQSSGSAVSCTDLEFLRFVEGGLGFSEVGSECLKGLIHLSRNGIGNK